MKILIVDDEPGAAERLAGEVAAAGFGEGYAATNAEAAVEIVNREGGVDVLATNVFLEGIDGFTLAESMRAQLPELRVIFLTAYDLAEHADRVGETPVLSQPVAASAFLAEIQNLIPAEPAPVAADLPPGTALGAYRIDALMGEDLDGKIYQATQTTIGRAVEFHVLAPERAADPAAVERFLANARAKASVSHPTMLSVFEAGESGGWYFYASEMRQGTSLWQLAQDQTPHVAAPVLLALLHTLAEAMVHLGQNRIAHEPLHAGHVLLDPRQRGRLVNVATQDEMTHSAREDMHTLALAIGPLVLPHPSSGALQQLLADMEAGAIPVRSWTALIYEVKRCAGAGAASVYKLDAGGRAEIAAVGAARRRHRARRNGIVILLLLVLIAGAAAWFFLGGGIPAWKS